MQKTAIILLIFFCVFNRSNAQWQQMNGPNREAYITALVSVDSTIIASSSFCGIFRSDAKLGKWQKISNDFFTCYFAIGDSLFFIGNDQNVKLINLKDNSVSNVSVAPTRGGVQSFCKLDSVFYYGNEYTGFTFSKDFGKTWGYANKGLPFENFTYPHGGGNVTWHHVYSVAASNNYLFAGTDKGVYRSKSDSMSWNERSKGLPITEIDLLKSYSNEVYTSIGNILYYSIDTGNTWSKLYTAPSKILSINKIDSILYIGVNNKGVYFYPNKNGKWDSISVGLTDKNVKHVIRVDSLLICATESMGVFASENNQWDQKIDGMTCSNVGALRATDSFIYANCGGDVDLSRDKQNWANVTPRIDSIPTNASDCWLFENKIMCSYTYTDSKTLKFVTKYVYSSDYGNTWRDRSGLPIKWSSDSSSHLTRNGTRLFSTNHGTPIYSDNNGTTWINIKNADKNCSPSLIGDGPNFYVSGCDRIYSFDDSFNYKMAFDLTDTRVAGGVMFLQDGVLFSSTNLAHLYCSLDSGKSWSDANYGIESIDQLYGFINDKRKFYISTDKGMFVTKNYGKYWQRIDDSTIGIEVFQIAINNDTLYAATGGKGVWKRPLNSIYLSVEDDASYEPTISLFPNPAQTSITVHSQTELHSASINLYNLQGQLVKSFSNINGKEFTIYRNNLPSGLYTMRILDREGRIYVSTIVLE